MQSSPSSQRIVVDRFGSPRLANDRSLLRVTGTITFSTNRKWCYCVENDTWSEYKSVTSHDDIMSGS